MDHGKLAEENFRKGYNCAQSVLLAFGDVTGLDDKTAAMLSSSFGGGLGRLREICGTVSGAAMVLGLVQGYADSDDPEAKTAHYHRVQEFDHLPRIIIRRSDCRGKRPRTENGRVLQKAPMSRAVPLCRRDIGRNVII